MSNRELRAAGITEPRLQAAYEVARTLNAEHGKTYYLATLLLPPAKRPFVHALYGFARYADEIVDNLSIDASPAERARVLNEFEAQFRARMADDEPAHPVIEAMRHTMRLWHIPMAHVDAFMHSMRLDTHVKQYETYEDLHEYVYGSAAVIGLQMVPILGGTDSRAFDAAMDLGIAFQLANFIRDVGEDLQRGRIYLPMSELRTHGVTREVLEQRITTATIKQALQEQIARVRMLQQRAEDGITLLDRDSQPCIRAASILYCGIVDAVEAIDYDVLNRRAAVSMPRRLSVAGAAWLRALAARR